ncbi:MAG: peptidoglycan DD-metalloendopeptidase family protein [Magnetospirillum sp.]|nr:peptidoglycan DD-metalloendopeptidase family protein [Magnetospirillum sp.]
MGRVDPHYLWRLASLVGAVAVLAGCEMAPSGGGAPVSRRGGGDARCASPIGVYSGDTVYSIARRCNVAVRDLIETNNLQPPYQLSGGMRLKLPGAAGEYVVQRGDTLIALARRFGTDLQTLARTNGKEPPYTIRVGETLRLPNAYGVAAKPVAGGPIVIASPNAQSQKEAARPVAVAVPPPPGVRPEPVPPPSGQTVRYQPPPPLPAEPPALAGRGFIWPLRGEVVAEFGPMGNKGQHNDGINIAAARGTPIRAIENGVVAYVGNELKGFGNLLLIKHADGWVSAYAHADQIQVRRGEAVKRGQSVATVGTSGGAAFAQLHFELRKGKDAVNPLDHLHDAPGA